MTLNTIYTLNTGSQISLALRSSDNMPFTSTLAHLICCLQLDVQQQLQCNRSFDFAIPSNPTCSSSPSPCGSGQNLGSHPGVLESSSSPHPAAVNPVFPVFEMFLESRHPSTPLLLPSRACLLAFLIASLQTTHPEVLPFLCSNPPSAAPHVLRTQSRASLQPTRPHMVLPVPRL